MDELIKYKQLFQSNDVSYNLALCFKNTPCDICYWDYYHWIDLVDDLYAYLDRVITENNMKLEVCSPLLSICLRPWLIPAVPF